MLYRKQRNYGCRIQDQLNYQGMRTLVLENEKLRMTLLLDKGSEVIECLYKPLDMDLVWLSENGVHNPMRYLSTSADPVAAFVDYYSGGWQEVLPNGGPTAHYMGAMFGQHGEVAQMPWDYEILQDDESRVQVLLSVKTKKVPFLLEKKLTLSANRAELEVEEMLHNNGAVKLHYMWGHHLAFGKPFIGPGCIIRLPDSIQVITEATHSEVCAPGRIDRDVVHRWPIATRTGPASEGGNQSLVDLSRLPEHGTASDIVYLTGFERLGWYALENPYSGLGLKVSWDAEQFPYLWYWQEFGTTTSYPWYGRHYNIGLEPFSSYPTHGLEEAIRNGSAASIEANEQKRFTMKLQVFEIESTNANME